MGGNRYPLGQVEKPYSTEMVSENVKLGIKNINAYQGWVDCFKGEKGFELL